MTASHPLDSEQAQEILRLADAYADSLAKLHTTGERGEYQARERLADLVFNLVDYSTASKVAS